MEEANEVMVMIYSQASIFAMANGQTVGEKNDFYITIEQLEEIIKRIQDDNAE